MKTITFKVNDDEARLIRARARKEKISVSEYLRRRATATNPTVETWGKIRCPVTGAMIFAAPKSKPQLTVESVREILVDFP